jgi:hypothetical protein
VRRGSRRVGGWEVEDPGSTTLWWLGIVTCLLTILYILLACVTHIQDFGMSIHLVSALSFLFGASIPDIHLSCKFSSLKLWLAIF